MTSPWTQTPWVKALIIVLSLGLTLALLYLLRIVLTPFFIALALAYLLDPAVDALQRLRLPRTAAVLLLLVGLLAAGAAMVMVLYPTIRLQGEILASEFPRYVGSLQASLLPFIRRVSQVESGEVQALLQDLLSRVEGLPSQMLHALSLVWGTTLASLRGLVALLLNLLVIPVATFYFLRDIDRIRAAYPSFLPMSYRSWITSRLVEIDSVLSGFVRGQLMIALILMALYSIGLSLVGTPLSVLLGLMTGAANLVPYMGLILGLVPSVGLTFLRFHDWQHPVGVLVVFGVIHLLEGNFITPRIMGPRLGLHPIIILLAVLVGGHLFGFLGIILAVPVAAVLKVFWRSFLDFYRTL
ncbi:MAG: AI-2E family transporter [Candidatus Entotheonellia bacterium]